MKKRTLIAVLGLWIALLPFLGLPASWKSRLFIISGLAVTILAVSRKKGVVAPVAVAPKAQSFTTPAPAVSPSVPSPSSYSPSVYSAEPQDQPVPLIKKPRKPRTIKTEQPQAVHVAISSEEKTTADVV